MSEPITFFRRRQQDAGHTYVFELEFSNRLYRIFVYSQKPVEEALVRSRKLADYKPEMDRIIQAAGQGGTVVQVVDVDVDRTRSFQVTPGGKAEKGSKICGVLKPGSALSLEEMKPGKWLDTPAGTHLLVSVDQEAEGRLKSFEEYLGALPPDLESLILYSIRKPSLDSRLRDLEARKAAMAGWSQIREWAVPILLVLILALNVVLLVRTLPKGGNSAAAVETSSESSVSPATSNNPPSPKNRPHPVTPPKPSQKIFEILQAVRAKAELAKAFALLRDRSFNGLAKEQNVAAALADEEKTKILVLGLMKLEALKLDTKEDANKLYGYGKNPLDTRRAFQTITKEIDANAKKLLEALNCTGYGEPWPSEEQSQDRTPFVPDSGCISLDQAMPGLEDLLKFVKDYSPQGGGSGGAS